MGTLWACPRFWKTSRSISRRKVLRICGDAGRTCWAFSGVCGENDAKFCMCTCDDTYFKPNGLTLSRGALRTKSDQCLGFISAKTTGSALDSRATYGVSASWSVGSDEASEWMSGRFLSSQKVSPLIREQACQLDGTGPIHERFLQRRDGQRRVVRVRSSAYSDKQWRITSYGDASEHSVHRNAPLG